MEPDQTSEKQDDATARPCQTEDWRPYITMTRSHRMQVGAKCKEIIDQGRIAWSKELGFSPKLVEYIDRKVSEENRLLLCRISDKSTNRTKSERNHVVMQ